jgi:CPA2 family monovalent cation:H+ antiporter-2
MEHASLVTEFTLLIGLSVAVIYLFLHLGLSTTLGFLAVGLLAGPSGLGLLQNNQALEEMAEFGVAFLLFSLGLEFSLSRLFAMRRMVLGIGGLQMLGTVAVIMVLSWTLGPLPWNGSLVCAVALALSSTAMVSQELMQRRELLSRHGMMTMGALLFQDLVSVFFLAMIPVLAAPHQDDQLWPLISSAGLAMALLAGMVLAGRFLFPRLFHAIAEVRSAELFMLTVLLVAMVAALLTERFGLSLGLGAFLAGMLLGESHFRHQIESDIRPFRDVLLGVFFVSVGMLIDLHSIWTGWPYVLGLTTAVLLLKAGLVAYLGTLQKERPTDAWRAALALAGTGEFGFALVTLGMVHKLVDMQAGSVVLGALMLGMLAVPPLIAAGPRLDKLLKRRRPKEIMPQEETPEPGRYIILCGYGRVGQGLGKLFREAGFAVIAMDLDPARVEQAVLLGHRVYYGNCAEPNTLARLHLEQAELLVITFDDPPITLKMIELIRQRHEKLPILVRAADDLHYEHYIAAGATEVIPETLEAGLMLASHALALLGWSQERISGITRRIRLGRYKLLRGYIPGQDEQFDAEETAERNFIKAVMLSEGSFGVGKRLGAMKLEEEGVAVDAIQRSATQEELAPGADLILEAGDVVVLKGKQQALEHCESRLLAP